MLTLLGLILAPLGAILWPSWALMEPSWYFLWPPWSAAGTSVQHLGAILPRLVAYLAGFEPSYGYLTPS